MEMEILTMVNKVPEVLVGITTAVITWLLLSYIFFPIKLSAPANEYFMATVTHMVPLKTLITIVFVLVVVFMYEQKMKNG